MSRIELVNPATAQGASGELLKQIHGAFGVVPNMFRGVANSPAALASMWGAFGALGGGTLGARLGEQIAVAIAMFGLFGSIGASIGQAIAGGIWTNILPDKIAEALPADMQDQVFQLYGNLSAVVEAPRGSPAREAVIEGYGIVQRYMVIAGACFIPLCLAALLLWKNVNVKKLEEEKGKQTKGTVF